MVGVRVYLVYVVVRTQTRNVARESSCPYDDVGGEEGKMMATTSSDEVSRGAEERLGKDPVGS